MSQSDPHHTVAARLTAKKELLEETARQFAYGTATSDDLAVAAVEFSETFIERAMAPLKEKSR